MFENLIGLAADSGKNRKVPLAGLFFFVEAMYQVHPLAADLTCAANFLCTKMNSIKRFLLTLIFLGASALVAGCATGGPGLDSNILAQVEGVATGSLQTKPAVVELAGKPAILYSTRDGRVALHIAGQRKLLDETARVKQGGGFFQLNSEGQNLKAFWWSHMDGKNVYFTSSANGGQSFTPVSMVNDEHGVLPPFTLTQGEQGVLGMVYHDERTPGFQAYFNRSTDGGRTWARPDVRLDTPPAQGRSSDVQETQSVVSGSTWVAAWADTVTIDGQASYRIVIRRSENAGISWLAPEVLYSSTRHISSLILRAQGNRVVIAADELEHGLVALSSIDQGRSWRNLGLLAGSEKVSNSGIDMTLAGERAHLVWMYDRNDEKVKIMRASLDIANAKWLGAAERLNTKQYENTGSTMPVVLATVQGQIIAAWVDYRDIRPNIYLSASHDQGQSWSAPQALLKPGEKSSGRPQLVPWGDQAAIAYEVYPSDKLDEAELVVRSLPQGEMAKGIPGMPTTSQMAEPQRKSRLEERVKTLLDARVAADYATAYDIFDFAYKATTSKKQYVETVGVITYLGYSIGDMAITGNEATVTIKTKYEVKPTIIPFAPKPMTVPPTEVESPTGWVWVGEDWYLVYKPAFDKQVLKY